MPKGIILAFLFLSVFLIFSTLTISGHAMGSRRAVIGIWLFDENDEEVVWDSPGNGYASERRLLLLLSDSKTFAVDVLTSRKPFYLAKSRFGFPRRADAF